MVPLLARRVAASTETEHVANGIRQPAHDLLRALALAIGNENLQMMCRILFPVTNSHLRWQTSGEFVTEMTIGGSRICCFIPLVCVSLKVQQSHCPSH